MNCSSTDRADTGGMYRTLLGSLFAAGVGLIVPAHATAAPAPRINCQFDHQLTLDLAPLQAGPLTLASVYCQYAGLTSLPRSAPIISPDGRSIAYYEHTEILRTARLDEARNWTSYNADLGVFARFGSETRSIPAFAWASNSQFLWSATHEKVRPSGWALTPMQPVKTAGDGTVQLLPSPEHSAGALDGLLWAGGDGLAIAHFGSRGGFYRPERPYPNPAFAFIDAQRGIVLDSLPFSAIASLRRYIPPQPPYVLVRNAAVAPLKDGRLRALLSVGDWVLWTQGETPVTLRDPYDGERFHRMIMSPDGSAALVGRLLRTEGGICGPIRGCTPGRPVEGVLAALHDVMTGQPRWAIRATVTNDYEFPTPAISPDGRYALIGLVPTDRPYIAVVTMDRGEIVQTIPAPGGDYAMGFAREGRTVWTHAHGLTAFYEVAD